MLKGAFILAAGIALGMAVQDRREAAEREAQSALIATTIELRDSSRHLRQRCPAKAPRIKPWKPKGVPA